MIGKMNVKESKIKDNILKWKCGGKEWIKMQEIEGNRISRS